MNTTMFATKNENSAGDGAPTLWLPEQAIFKAMT